VSNGKQLPTFRRTILPPRSKLSSQFFAMLRAEDGSMTILRNVGDYSPVYPAHRPRRYESAAINLSKHYVVLYFKSATWLG